MRAISGARRVEKTLKRYPELKIIVPHLGFDGPVVREKLIQYADRILYGSDYPHIPYGMEREVRRILQTDLGEEVTHKILYVNATEVYPIKLH